MPIYLKAAERTRVDKEQGVTTRQVLMRLKGYEEPQEGFIQKAKGVLGKFFTSLVKNALGRG